MNRKEFLEWVKREYGAEPDFPWSDNNAVLRHRENKKWFALLMDVGRNKLGLPGEGTVEALNIKCDPILIDSLRTQPGFHPAYHMSKEKWITLRLDGTIPDDQIQALTHLSYQLTNTKSRK